MDYRLRCPHCRKRVDLEVEPPESRYSVECDHCNKSFRARIVTIRAKRSRGDRNANSRAFSIRAITASGQEEFLEFSNASYEDFELRQGDEAGFLFVNGEVRVVHNFTIGRVWFVSRPSCYIASHIYGPTSAEVSLLRGFRDQVLLPYWPLSILVELYYRISPAMIRVFGRSGVCLWFMRTVVSLVVCAIRRCGVQAESGTVADRPRE
jgi:hypothetical protein